MSTVYPEGDWRAAIGAQIGVLRVLSFGMATPPLFILAIAWFTGRFDQWGSPEFTIPYLPMIAIGISILMGILAAIIPSRLVRRSIKALIEGSWQLPQSQSNPAKNQLAELIEAFGEPAKVWAVLLMSVLSRCTCLELAGVANAVIVLIQPHWIPLVLALAFPVIIFVTLPGKNQVLSWIDEQLWQIERERQLQRAMSPRMPKSETPEEPS